ncbi:MAG: hypothetical protein WCC14_08185 [Acidobacteriaceae bacterium]
MIRPGTVALLLLLVFAPDSGIAQSAPSQAPAVLLPAGSKIELAVIRPMWAKTARPGDPIYTQTDFPVTVGEQLAIPAGTFVEGTLESITPPARRSSRAELEILFTQVIFADGYAVSLPDVWPAPAASSGTPVSTAVRVAVEVSTSNDLLLDNGAQIEITLAMPLELDAGAIAAAVPLTHAPAPGSFHTATLCRPSPGMPGSPGTPGTPDIVIPGTPGTPDTIIPGGPGMPDTTIPGTPATPPTVIPGTPGTPDTPGTPGTVCPPAPIVVSSAPIVAASTPAGPTPANTH